MYYYIAKCKHGDVHLYGSSYSTIGIVTLCINGTWGTVCGDKWDNNDASVVCKHLGYSRYGKIYIINSNFISFIKGAIPAGNYYNNNGYPVYIFDLNCTGTEDSIWDCSYNQTTQSCSHKTYSNKDASVICQC